MANNNPTQRRKSVSASVLLWGYFWIMNVKLVLEWTSLLSHLLDLVVFARAIVEWWRSFYYPFLLNLGVDLPPAVMDVLGISFSLFNISLLLIVLAERNLFDRYNVPEAPSSRLGYLLRLLRAQFFGIIIYVLLRLITDRRPHGRITKHLVQETPIRLYQLILAIVTFISSAAVIIALLKDFRQLAMLFATTIFSAVAINLVATAWFSPIALHFLRKSTDKSGPKSYNTIEIHPMRWIIGVLIAIITLNLLYEIIPNQT